MKKALTILFVLVLTSCSTSTQESAPAPLTEETATLPDTLPAQQNQEDSIQEAAYAPLNGEESEECIFDQATRTDKFLQNAKELKGYQWDYEKRTATVVLETGDSLFIYRGGCNHFMVSAEFRLRKDKTDYTKWDNVYQKVLWIAKILNQEFDYQDLRKDIETNKVTIEKQDHADVASFSNEILVDKNYSIVRELGPEVKVITLSYSII